MKLEQGHILKTGQINAAAKRLSMITQGNYTKKR
jgi:hypothetical protein